MVGAFFTVRGTLRVPALALAHSIAYSGGAVVLYLLARGGLPRVARPHVARSVLVPLGGAVLAGLVMWTIGRVADPVSRMASLGVMVIAAGIGMVVYATVTAASAGPARATSWGC